MSVKPDITYEQWCALGLRITRDLYDRYIAGDWNVIATRDYSRHAIEIAASDGPGAASYHVIGEYDDYDEARAVALKLRALLGEKHYYYSRGR